MGQRFQEQGRILELMPNGFLQFLDVHARLSAVGFGLRIFSERKSNCYAQTLLIRAAKIETIFPVSVGRTGDETGNAFP